FERLRAAELYPAWPAGGHFLWVPVGDLGLDGRQLADLLLRLKKVQIWPGHHFGPHSAGYIRISYAAEDGRLQQGLARMADFVHQLRATGPRDLETKAA